MSTIPSRTRSIRKPAEAGTASNTGYSESGSHSPSRLPVKPTTRSTTAISRPPSSASVVSNASMRPPPSRVSSNTRSTSVGPQKLSSSRHSNPLATAESEPAKKDRSRPPITTSRHLRNTSISSITTKDSQQPRTRSSSTQSAAPSLRPPTRGSATESKPQNVQPEPQHKKPAFSTLQQHFSPAKNLAPKPHPAAFLAPPSPSKLPSNVAISAETAKLQNELLQLHLLHKDAICVEREWTASAKRKLGSQFNSVVEQKDRLMRLEVQEKGKINAAALKTWQDFGVPGWGLEGKLPMLDEVITGIWNMNEAGGKYAKIVRKFERWIRRCQDVLDARKHNDGLEDDQVIFLEELDSSWKDDCLIIGRKLETWKNQLENLGNPACKSSLGVVIDGTSRFINNMLVELSMMAQIEQDTIGMELRWIKSMNDDSLDDGHDSGIGAIWRSR